MRLTQPFLDGIYRRFNRRSFVHPDPLEFLYCYRDVRDREVVALIAASLAFGRVMQILKSVARVLGKMGEGPRRFIMSSSDADLRGTFAGFRHRFVGEVEFVSLLSGMRDVIRRYGSLNECFLNGKGREDETVVPALGHFRRELGVKSAFLVPDTVRGSAAKRLQLFLRWMVRKDMVDPGGWTGVSPAQLVIPLDTHMARIGRMFGLTKRKSPGLAMALDITAAFRRMNPSDPVKYDFALTRFGIHPGMNASQLRTLVREGK